MRKIKKQLYTLYIYTIHTHHTYTLYIHYTYTGSAVDHGIRATRGSFERRVLHAPHCHCITASLNVTNTLQYYFTRLITLNFFIKKIKK